jgi:hypothetical protein
VLNKTTFFQKYAKGIPYPCKFQTNVDNFSFDFCYFYCYFPALIPVSLEVGEDAEI